MQCHLGGGNLHDKYVKASADSTMDIGAKPLGGSLMREMDLFQLTAPPRFLFPRYKIVEF